MKKCARCNQIFPLKDFPIDKSKKDGHKSYCFECNRIVINKSTLKRKEKRKQDNIRDREKIHEYNIQYYQKNKSLFQKNYKKYLKENISFKLAHNLRIRINKALIKDLKTSSSIFLLGCSIKKYKLYLENQFDENMNWGNYGTYWEIDHIIPCANFDLSNLEEQKKCFNYKNTRPLEKKENQIKNKY